MNATLLCMPDPEKVALTAASFQQIKAQRDTVRLATFVFQVVVQAGGTVTDVDDFQSFVLSAEW